MSPPLLGSRGTLFLYPDLPVKMLFLPFGQTHRWLEERLLSNVTEELMQTEHDHKAANEENESIQGSRRRLLNKNVPTSGLDRSLTTIWFL